MSKLVNCPECGSLFLQVRSLCSNCIKQIEDDFIKVSTYLKEHRASTLQEVSDETEVAFSRIRQFIISGRLIIENHPNLEYPCERCGTMIRHGRKCASCTNEIKGIIRAFDQQGTNRPSKSNEQPSNEKSSYRTFRP